MSVSIQIGLSEKHAGPGGVDDVMVTAVVICGRKGVPVVDGAR
jgi:hypothetical protein